jgi:ribonuclease D
MNLRPSDFEHFPAMVTTTAELAALCDRLAEETFVTVDTEFMRERTYWPELCVIQLGGSAETAVVDALAPGMDLAPLGTLLANPAVVKVFHAARQDVEIFLLKFDAVPTPLFDTQVAAMVAGFGDQVSYDQLCRSLANASIDKAHRFSDWSARPLSPSQIAYAAADVTHLRRIYTGLTAKLAREGRLDWVAEEMAALTDPATYRTEPEDAWEKLRSRSTNRRFLGMLRAVAGWRESEAQRINIPRQRLVKDETLLEIAATAPETIADLTRARGISEGFAKGRSGSGLLAAIKAAKGEAEATLPEPPRDRHGPPASPALVALLKVLLAARSEEHDVAPRLLANSEELERLAAEPVPDIPALRGWRRDVFGEAAMALKEGRLALGVDGRKVKLISG